MTSIVCKHFSDLNFHYNLLLKEAHFEVLRRAQYLVSTAQEMDPNYVPDHYLRILYFM